MCPSNRVIDPDNTEGPSLASGHKRKASHSMTAPGHQINRIKVADIDEGSSDGGEISDYEPNVADTVTQPAESSDDLMLVTRSQRKMILVM